MSSRAETTGEGGGDRKVKDSPEIRRSNARNTFRIN